MPFPEGLPTKLVKLTVTNPVGGGAAKGTVKLSPNVPTIVIDGTPVQFTGSGTYGFDSQGRLVDSDGTTVGVRLLDNSAAGSNPAGWLWHAIVSIEGQPPHPFYFTLAGTLSEVDLAELIQVEPGLPRYVAVPGPAGPTGPAGPQGSTGPQGEPGPQPELGAAGAADDVALRSTDPSTTNARTPTAHKTSHAAGGSDPLTPGDIGADPTGTAASAVSAHAADTTDVHGIVDTALLETTAGAAAKVSAHSAVATNVHGIADSSLLETTTGAQSKADAAQFAATTAAATDATSKVTTHTNAADPHGDRAWADSKFALSLDLTTLNGTVNNLSTTVTAIDGFLNDCLTRVAAIEQGTAWLGGLNVNGNAQIANGNLTVGGNLTATGSALGQATPATHGVAAWCYDPALAVNSTSLSNGTLYLTRVDIAASMTATKIYWWVGNSGSSPVSGQNHIGLYNSSGTLLAAVNVDAAVSSAALKTTTIPAQALTAGSFYWVAMVFNASVAPTLTRASGWTGVATAANLGLVATTYRFATNGTGRTTLPSSITPGSNVGTDFAGPWAAVGP